jgi:hypothetical protein
VAIKSIKILKKPRTRKMKTTLTSKKALYGVLADKNVKLKILKK